MLLDHLLSHLPGANYDPVRFRTAGRRQIRGVTADPRLSAPGMVFVSLPERQRGNPFQAFAAIERGCDAVVRDQATPAPRGGACVEVADARCAFGRMASALNDHPSRRLAVFGVAGAAGPRARLAGVLTSLLGAAGGRCARFSPAAMAAGDRVLPWELDEIDAGRVHTELARHAQAGGTACVVELGLDALAGELTDGIEFRRRVQAVDDMPDFLVPTRLSTLGSFCTWHRDGREHRMATPLTGRLQLAALGRALELAADAGVPAARLLGMVSALEAPTGWLEPVRCGQRFGVFVDAARDPMDLDATLASARELTTGRLLVVTGPRMEQTADARRALASVAGRRADAVLVTSDDACAREFGEMAPEFVDEAVRGGAAVLLEGDRHRAIQRACGAARSGDVVVVAGKALSPTQRLGEVRMPWDDRVHLRSALGALGHVGGEF